MRIRSFTHKGLRRLYEEGVSKGVPAAAVDKLRKQLAFLEALRNVERLRALTLWGAHQLSGNRSNQWSLTVTRNYRLTFRIDPEEPCIYDIDLEDYH